MSRTSSLGISQSDILSDATPFTGANIANLDVAISTRSTITATDKGVRQVFEKAIVAATNSGANTLGTVTTQACTIESIVIYTNAALEANTTCAVTGGAGAVTFIDAGTATAANLADDGNQVSWTGAVRLAATKTIITTLAGGAGAASNLVFVITYYSSSASGGTIV